MRLSRALAPSSPPPLPLAPWPSHPEYMWCVSAYLPHQLPFPVSVQDRANVSRCARYHIGLVVKLYRIARVSTSLPTALPPPTRPSFFYFSPGKGTSVGRSFENEKLLCARLKTYYAAHTNPRMFDFKSTRALARSFACTSEYAPGYSFAANRNCRSAMRHEMKDRAK